MIEEPTAVLWAGLDEAAFRRRTAGEPAVLRAKREAAFAAYRRLPAPGPRDEEWRRTDPARLDPSAFRLAPTPPRAAEAHVCELGAQFDVAVCVDDRQVAIADRAGLLGAGRIRVATLAEMAASDPAWLERHLQGPALPEAPRKFTALADAFWHAGLVVHVPAGVALERGVLVRHRPAAAGSLLTPRLLVVVDDGASVTVAEHYESPAGVPMMVVGSREFYVGPGANLRVISLQEWGDATLHVGEDWSRVARDGRIDWVTLTLGGRLGKLMCGCDVAGPGAQAHLTGLYFADGDRHVDQRTLQKHSAPHTQSHLLYKGAVKDTAHSVYQGVIAAGRGAIKVDAYQMNKNLVLGEGARADSLPGLEIDADDLKCSHGATTGTLDDEQLFYLQARGLPRARARQILVNGFFEEVVARVPVTFMQERVREHVERSVR